MRRFLISVVLVGVASGVDTAAAQVVVESATAARPMKPEARRHFEQATRLYDAERFEEALAEFEKGSRADAHPDFLYAMGQTERKLGRYHAAIDHFRAFLRTNPPPTEILKATANIERCEAELAGKVPPSTRSPPPSSGAAPPAMHRPWYRDAPGNVLAATGIVGLGIGGACFLIADSRIQDANAATGGSGTLMQYEDAAAAGSRFRTAGIVASAAGGALLLGGLVRYAMRGPGPEAALSVTATPVAGGAVVMISGI